MYFYLCMYLRIFIVVVSECDCLSEAEIIELIEAKTKLIEDKSNEIETKNKEIEAKNKEIEAKTKVIEANTKMIEAKCVSEIELVKAKCLSEAKIIELIESKIESAKLGSGKLIDCPINNPIFRIVDGTCLR